MPVAVRRDPSNGSPQPPKRRTANPAVLRRPQVRVLAALQPSDPTAPVFDWPVVTRRMLGVKLGYSPTNSLNRLLNVQLVRLGLIEVVVLDIDGVLENSYRITVRGIECLSRHEAR